MKNKIEDLRDHLFETLEGLRDKESPLDIERAEAIARVAQVIVDTAKTENDFIKLTGNRGSGFIAPQPIDPSEIRTAIEAGGSAPRQLKAGGNGRLASTLCPDPNCGGFLTPKTNGNGGLRDVCDKCHRTVNAAASA